MERTERRSGTRCILIVIGRFHLGETSQWIDHEHFNVLECVRRQRIEGFRPANERHLGRLRGKERLDSVRGNERRDEEMSIPAEQGVRLALAHMREPEGQEAYGLYVVR